MNITPDQYMLRERIDGQKLTWLEALGELIDNAFDANATQVKLTFQGRSFILEDDGEGTDDLEAMFTFGGHRPRLNTTVGVHGVGFKDASLWLSSDVEVRTTTKTRKSSVKFSWSDVTMTPDRLWVAPDPKIEEPSGPTGTWVKFHRLRSDRLAPRPGTFDRLALIFMPALRAGRQIVVKRGRPRSKPMTLPVPNEPNLTELVEDEFEIAGKSVKIRIGILEANCRPAWDGFAFIYGHRVLEFADLGTGRYSTNRISGLVHLSRGWKVARNKDDITANKNELAEAIYSRCKFLFQKAELLSEEIESTQIREELESLIDAAVDNYKREARKGKGDETGTVLPAFTGRQRRRAAAVSDVPGSVDDQSEAPRRKHGIYVKWWRGNEDGPVGKVDRLSKSVSLNTDHPFISSARTIKNIQALYAIAWSLFCHSVCNSDASGTSFFFEKTDYVSTWSRMLHELGEEDGKKRKTG